MELDCIGLSRALAAFQCALDGRREETMWTTTATTAVPKELFSNEDAFRTLFTELSVLKRARKVIQTMQKSLSTDITRLEVLLLGPSRKHGLSNLPDEILLKIFISSIRDDNLRLKPQGALQKLLAVSKRFRNLLNGSIQAWTHINSNDGIQLIKTKLARTDGCKLHVHLAQPSKHKAAEIGVVKMLAKRARDCSHLYLSLRPYSQSGYTWPGTQTELSSLEVLIVRKKVKIPESWTFPAIASLSIPFVTSVPLPQQLAGLRDLSINNVVSTREHPYTTVHTDCIAMLDALRQAPLLESLSLRGFFIGEGWSQEKLKTVRLAHLSTLTLASSEEWLRESYRSDAEKYIVTNTLSRMAAVSRALYVPSLQTFHLVSEYDHRFFPGPDEKCPLFFSKTGRANVLKLRLHFEKDPIADIDAWKRDLYRSYDQSSVDMFIPGLVKQFPTLQSLSLRSSIYTDQFKNIDIFLGLRSLYIYGLWSPLSFLPRIARSLESQRRSDKVRLREVILHSRSKLNDCYSYPYFAEKRDRLDIPATETTVVLEKTIGETSITVMETISVPDVYG